MRYCGAHHTDSCATRQARSLTTTVIRFIDVRQRQLVVGDLDFHYVALSYVWGPNTKPLLKISTLNHYLQCGSLVEEDIPRIIWEALELIADLGHP